jgi:hypothetical protein
MTTTGYPFARSATKLWPVSQIYTCARALLVVGLAGSVGCVPVTDQSNETPTAPTVTYTTFSLNQGTWYGPGGLSGAKLAAPSALTRNTRFALERTPGPWSLTSSGVGSITPDLTRAFAQNCIRDQYVSAAMIGAYGVEYSARKNDMATAAQFASTMNSSLSSAYLLCDFSGRPPLGNVTCSTQAYMTCEDLRTLLG